MEQQHLVAEAAPAEVIDEGLEEEEREQAVELASECVPNAVLDVVLEKSEAYVSTPRLDLLV